MEFNTVTWYLLQIKLIVKGQLEGQVDNPTKSKGQEMEEVCSLTCLHKAEMYAREPQRPFITAVIGNSIDSFHTGSLC